MSGRIDTIFTALRRDDKRAIMPFITAGYPSLETTAQSILAMERAGASIVELGVPFSDPIADGPVIASSMHEALQAGVTPAAVFEVIREVRPKTNIGIVLMVSDSIVTRMGVQAFVDTAADVGVDGLIIPDIDVDAAATTAQLVAARGMTLSLLIAPTTTPKRLKQIVNRCSGFVYLLGRAGVTGERDDVPDVSEAVSTIRAVRDLPIAVGFGISTPEHVAAVTAHADAAIVGSALVRRMGEADDPVSAAENFVASLAGGLRWRYGQRLESN